MNRINRLIRILTNKQTIETLAVENWQAKRAQYLAPGEYQFEDEASQVINVGDHLINSGTTMFLKKELSIPAEWRGDLIGLKFHVGQAEIATNHEGLVLLDNKPYHGIDRNRSVLYFPENSKSKSSYQVAIELFNPEAQVVDRLNYQNAPAEHSPAPLFLLESQLIRVNRAVEDLLFTVKTYNEAARLLPDHDVRKSKIMTALIALYDQLLNEGDQVLADQARVKSIETELLRDLQELKDLKNGKMHMVGQSHIDLAWLWPAKEAVRKTSRTFSTMSTLLDQFPDFGYVQSQPQAFEFMKEYYPDVYQRVKDHIASGRWELVGGMWVEPDLNIPSGESLVRQLVYGMKFYQEEFGIKPRIEWLPDTFGYSASLPQLLKKAGLDYFMTTKMNWNDTNAFPYDLFNWQGIDGTNIISYLNHGVNEFTHPKEIHEHWESYKQKTVHPEQMLLYGHGDGGGGVTREMIKYVERSENLPGLPEMKFSTAHDFFDGIKERNPKLPTWTGDMYLELHRGTYTTHARNKRWNRKAEVLYRDAEIWTSFASWYGGKTFSQAFEKGWKSLLFNQFHDIIPGTSIPSVYQKSTSDYEEIFAIGHEIKDTSIELLEQEINTLGEGTPVVIFNSLSWSRSEIVKVNGGKELTTAKAYDQDGNELKTDIRSLEDGKVELSVFATDIPEMGYQTIWLRNEQDHDEVKSETYNGTWETDYYKVEWNEQGEIARLYDKKASRDVLKAGEVANQLQLFHDNPPLWDAWDIDPNFEQQLADRPELESVEVIQRGQTKDILQFKWSVSNSIISQDIIFYHHSKRIDFETKVEWQEDHKLLKVSFPVDILADRATFEIPFGSIDRPTHNNTTWEQAQYEVCGHRFADLSEANYGVSLLNDCKYGYDVKGNVLRMSLLRAPKWPDPNADQGSHQFTYSLYPHQGDWKDAQTVKIGHELNTPVTPIVTTSHQGNLPNKHSFIELDAENVVLDTVKPGETEGLVLRLYEATGGREKVNVRVDMPVDKAEEINLLEEYVATLPLDQEDVNLEYRPYEVKTIRLNGEKPS